MFSLKKLANRVISTKIPQEVQNTSLPDTLNLFKVHLKLAKDLNDTFPLIPEVEKSIFMSKPKEVLELFHKAAMLAPNALLRDPRTYYQLDPSTKPEEFDDDDERFKFFWKKSFTFYMINGDYDTKSEEEQFISLKIILERLFRIRFDNEVREYSVYDLDGWSNMVGGIASYILKHRSYYMLVCACAGILNSEKCNCNNCIYERRNDTYNYISVVFPEEVSYENVKNAEEIPGISSIALFTPKLPEDDMTPFMIQPGHVPPPLLFVESFDLVENFEDGNGSSVIYKIDPEYDDLTEVQQEIDELFGPLGGISEKIYKSKDYMTYDVIPPSTIDAFSELLLDAAISGENNVDEIFYTDEGETEL